MTTMQQTPLFDEHSEKEHDPVECLGMTFENDEARRIYFTERLSEKLQDPEFRKIEGFPIGEEEDILRLSDPPYYTACPNPFLTEVLAEWQKERQATRAQLGLPEQAEPCEPFAADVSEGKNDPIYNAHSYHTKVPHKAIMRYILHYTEPGDIVFDGFCGTGMTGVAAQLCGDKKAVESLGYRVDADGWIYEINRDGQDKQDKDKKPISRLGARKAVLNDLSPAATFIAYNYNTPVDAAAFEREAKRILQEVEQECGWMYETWHPNAEAPNGIKGRINYIVWSDVFVCPQCSREMVFWDMAIDKEKGEIRDVWNCPGCAALLAKSPSKGSGALRAERAWETRFDRELKQTIRQARQVPVLINYSVGKKRFEKIPDASDLELIRNIERSEIPYLIPADRMPEGSESRRNDDIGLTHVHHYYTRRNLWILAAIQDRINSLKLDCRLMDYLEIWFTSSHSRLHRLNRYMYEHHRHVGPLSGTLYVSSTPVEISPYYFVKSKLDDHNSIHLPKGVGLITTNSSTRLPILDKSIDYIFIDPPFGSNLNYSELNFIIEAWLKVVTNSDLEAIVNKSKNKLIPQYAHLMTLCFNEFIRILKPGGWLTVEFHNSQDLIWNVIQESLQKAYFVVADVRVLDKQKGTTKQLTYASAVKQDLVISAYKPNGNLEERFKLKAGTEDGAWEFVRYHLGKLPLVNIVDDNLMVNQERQSFLLFDRMIAFHVQRGILVPLSASEFYAGLTERFPERDGMFFLSDQVNEYDQARLQTHQVQQLQFFVSDESSAILWLRQQLEPHPQTYSDLFPKFIREISTWQKFEKSLELSEILDQNFISYDGAGPIPEQIWSWMQKDEESHEAVKGQTRENPSNAVHTLTKGRWFVPDSNNAQQLEKVREKALQKEFESYKSFSGKKLKVFRLEAVRTGFKKAWQDRDYKTIIAVAEKISEDALQQDPKLLMWYDQALTRMEE